MIQYSAASSGTGRVNRASRDGRRRCSTAMVRARFRRHTRRSKPRSSTCSAGTSQLSCFLSAAQDDDCRDNVDRGGNQQWFAIAAGCVVEQAIKARSKGCDELDRTGGNAKDRTECHRTEFATHNDRRQSGYVTDREAEQYARADKYNRVVGRGEHAKGCRGHYQDNRTGNSGIHTIRELRQPKPADESGNRCRGDRRGNRVRRKRVREQRDLMGQQPDLHRHSDPKCDHDSPQSGGPQSLHSIPCRAMARLIVLGPGKAVGRQPHVFRATPKDAQRQWQQDHQRHSGGGRSRPREADPIGSKQKHRRPHHTTRARPQGCDRYRASLIFLEPWRKGRGYCRG